MEIINIKQMENTIVGKEITIENLTPQVAKIYRKDENRIATLLYPDSLVLDMGNKTKNDILDTSIKITGPKGFKILSSSSSCGCTDPSFKKSEDEEDTYIGKISFSPSKLSNGAITKSFSYQTSLGKIAFALIINH